MNLTRLIVAVGTVLSFNVYATKDIVVPLKYLPSEFNPQKIRTIYEMVVDLQIHRGLMRFLPDLTIAPDLAESYEVFDGGKRIRFKLAHRAFADGRIIVAQDVVRTFQRLFAKGAGFAADIDYIKGARSFLKSKAETDFSKLGVRAIDDKTVEFELEHSVGIFLSHLSAVDAAILPVNEKLEVDSKNGAGPYRIISASADKIELELKSDLKVFYPDAVIKIRFVPLDTAGAIKAALNNEVHSLDGYSVPPEITAQLTGRGWQESVSTITRQLYLVQNPNKTDKRIRELIFNAVISSPAKLITGPYSKSYGLIPDSLQGALVKNDIISPLCVKSKKMSDSVELTIVGTEPYLVELGGNLRNLIKVCGIDLKIKSIALDKYMPTIESKDYQIIVQSKFLDYPDGMSTLTYFRTTSASNTFFIRDKTVDAMLDQAMRELDSAKRIAFYKKIQNRILSHKIVVPAVFGSDNRGLWHSHIKKIPAHPLGLQGFPMETMKVNGL